MTALLAIGMSAPLWLGFSAIGWRLYRARRAIRSATRGGAR